MLTIKWTADCELGVELIDKQHKGLIDLMNDLAEAIERKKASADIKEDLVAIAKELSHYTEQHFNDEERLYEDNKIGSEDHKRLHNQFTQKLNVGKLALIENAEKDNLSELLTLYRGLLTWFMEHIKGEDRQQWERLKHD